MKIKAFQCRSFNDSYNITLSEPIVRSIISLRQSYIPSSSSESIHTTLGAKLTIFPHFFPLNSAPTTPRTLVPKGSPRLFNKTQALSSNLIYLPSGLRISFATQTIRAFLTSPFLIAIFAAKKWRSRNPSLPHYAYPNCLFELLIALFESSDGL